MEDLESRFTYHAPREGQPEMYQIIRFNARELASRIDELCPDGREKSLAVTKLEEAVMWANAAIARSGHVATLPESDQTFCMIDDAAIETLRSAFSFLGGIQSMLRDEGRDYQATDAHDLRVRVASLLRDITGEATC